MMLTRSARRYLRAFTLLLLLLWQGAVAAQACAYVATYADGCATSQPCHAPDAQDQATGHGSHPAHQAAQHVTTGPAKPSVPAAADLPALTTGLDPPVADARAHFLLVAALPAARAESPPLTILYCCFRN
jgi:hypothetical protein